MKSIGNLMRQPTGLPFLADDVLEFHAARLILLLELCGNHGRVRGLTKMAKLDFFVRYPKFFGVVCQALGKEVEPIPDLIESSMVRYHYGPWDQRYYHVLAYLESRGLVKVDKEGRTFLLSLTPLGRQIATQLEEEPAFDQLVQQMNKVNVVLGSMHGSRLKKLIYDIFEQEIAQLSLEEVIK
jgi:hypothetical protein